jgi:D-alanine-D-alanine ligase
VSTSEVGAAARTASAHGGKASDLGNFLVLAGGSSFEREVSLASGRRIAEALAGIGIETRSADIDPGLLPTLTDDPPDAVFLALHGPAGEDGAIRGILDLLEIAYVGSGTDACRIAYDKPTAKAALRAARLVTPPAIAVPHTTFRELGASAVLDRIVAQLGLPLVTKPAQGGGSALGAAIVTDADSLPTALVSCFSYGDTALVERFVDGIEVAVSVVDTGAGPLPLPAVEIVPTSGPLFDYAARYTPGRTEYHVPARLSDRQAAAVAQAAESAHRGLGLRDLSRVDIIVRDDVPHVLEVNVAPGMTETSLLPMAAVAADLDVGVLCQDLLHVAANRPQRS